MKKDEMLEHWRSIPENQKIRMAAVMYKHTGSTFDEDGIRITGSKKFIDSILSRLKDLLEFEGIETRLQVAYQQAKEKNSGAPLDSYCCYIQVHERGDEAKILQAYIHGGLAAGQKQLIKTYDKAGIPLGL